jgi:hypothetical protein
LRILFAGGNGWLPEATGGTQNSTDHLIRQAASAGHDCAVFCGLVGRGAFGLRMRAQRKVLGRPFSIDRGQGYEVMRTWTPFAPETIGAAVARFRPDVAVVQTAGSARLAAALRALGVPVVVYLRNVEFEENGGDVSAIPGARYIANSGFTAAAYGRRYGLRCTVIPPTIDADAYRSDGPRDCATLINIHPVKGYAIVRDMARACPEIPFLFVEGWALDEEALRQALAEIEALPNATFLPRTRDMRAVYGRTRVLLAPSQWEEAWGRVASEAHCSGIPVIGSDRGGLPQSIGPGGLILPHNAHVADWVAALRSVWTDERTYAGLSQAALSYATRPDLNANRQFETFMEVLRDAVGAVAVPRQREVARAAP